MIDSFQFENKIKNRTKKLINPPPKFGPTRLFWDPGQGGSAAEKLVSAVRQLIRLRFAPGTTPNQFGAGASRPHLRVLAVQEVSPQGEAARDTQASRCPAPPPVATPREVFPWVDRLTEAPPGQRTGWHPRRAPSGGDSGCSTYCHTSGHASCCG